MTFHEPEGTPKPCGIRPYVPAAAEIAESISVCSRNSRVKYHDRKPLHAEPIYFMTITCAVALGHVLYLINQSINHCQLIDYLTFYAADSLNLYAAD